MIPCKNCQQDTTTKNGFVRNKQRYKCQAYLGYNFVLGDARHKRSTELKKALSIILYSLGKSSFGFFARNSLACHGPQPIIGFDKRPP